MCPCSRPVSPMTVRTQPPSRSTVGGNKLRTQPPFVCRGSAGYPRDECRLTGLRWVAATGLIGASPAAVHHTIQVNSSTELIHIEIGKATADPDCDTDRSLVSACSSNSNETMCQTTASTSSLKNYDPDRWVRLRFCDNVLVSLRSSGASGTPTPL